MISHAAPLVPKDPRGPLRVILIGRVSTELQSLANIDASFEADEKYLRQFYSGPVEIRRLGERGSGLRTDRETIIEAEELIATQIWDLVLMEDLARAYRNPRHQYAFVQDAVDAGTRVICIGDNLDTADPHWETTMMTATIRHGLHIPDTRRRVRRTADHSFQQGGMVLKIRYGYRRLTVAEAATGDFGPRNLRIALVPEATPVIREMRERVLRGDLYESIADWLNDEGVPSGPYVTSGRWTGELVRRLLRDPILHGLRRLRMIRHEPIHRTGKYRRVKNAAGPETQLCPSLAHMTEEEQRELWAVMDQRRAAFQRKSGRENARFGVPRNRAIWPAQHLRCGVCGALLERTLDDQLKCKNSFKKGGGQCWNHVQVKAESVRQALLPRLLQALQRVPEFRERLIDSAWSAYHRRRLKHHRRDADLSAIIEQEERHRRNLVKAIASGGELDSLVAALREAESRLANVRAEHAAALAASKTSACRSRDEFVAAIDQEVLALARQSFEFTDLMREFVDDLRVVPVQARDSTQVRPRVIMTIRLSGGHADAGSPGGPLRLEADCFQAPGPVRILEACRQALAEHPDWGCKRIAKLIDPPHMTVKRALCYWKLMEAAGSSDPYQELTERPEKAARWVKRRPKEPAKGSDGGAF